MSKLLLMLILVATLPACAQHHYHSQHRSYHGSHNSWITPMIIGAGVTYILTRPTLPTPQHIIVQPGQQIACNKPYQVYNSIRGVYEIKQDCWVQ